MTIPFEKLKARLLADPRSRPNMTRSLQSLRFRRTGHGSLAGGDVPDRPGCPNGTSQSTIARLESGQTLPSTKTLIRFAQATGNKFHVRLSRLDAGFANGRRA